MSWSKYNPQKFIPLVFIQQGEFGNPGLTGLPGPPGDSSFSGLQGDRGDPGEYFVGFFVV